MKTLLLISILWVGMAHAQKRRPADDGRSQKSEVPAAAATIRGPLPGDFDIPTAPQGRNDDVESEERIAPPPERDDSTTSAPSTDNRSKSHRDREEIHAR